jgi:DNA recombination protein RmuC
MTIVIGFLLLLVCVLIFLLLKRPQPQNPDLTHSITLMQQHVEALRSDVHASIQNVTENVNRQLGAVTQQLQSQTGVIGNRLDSAARVIGDVQRNLGELGKATEEIKQLGLSVAKLDELLRAPKLRGGLGEFLLEDLLKQVLPAEHFVMQYRFRNGATVDAVVRTSDHMVSIDSKFPLENFRKMIHAATDLEKKAFQRAFVGDVRKHIDAIAEKYILPDEGTFPFAVMYIPAENIYYEVIIKDDSASDTGIYSYALERKVVPVSPNSFYAYLQVIALGLRGMSIERSARQILNTLTRLQDDLVNVRETFATLGSHLDNARKKYDEADKRLSNLETKIDQIAEQSLPEARPHTVRDENVLMSS